MSDVADDMIMAHPDKEASVIAKKR